MSNDASNIEHYIVVYNVLALTRVVDPSETRASLQHMLLHKWLFPLKNRPQRHCFVDIQVRRSYQRLHSNGLLSLNDLSHWDVIITRLLIPKPESFLTDTLLSGQCRFLRWAESRVSPILKVPLSMKLIGLCVVCHSCVHAYCLWEAVQVTYWWERKMFFFSSCLQNEGLVLLHMRE